MWAMKIKPVQVTNKRLAWAELVAYSVLGLNDVFAASGSEFFADVEDMAVDGSVADHGVAVDQVQ